MESQSIDERSRLLPAIPHRSYLYTDDELVKKNNQQRELLTETKMDACFVRLESGNRARDDELCCE